MADSENIVAAAGAGTLVERVKITPAARHYRLHREEQLARKKEEYNNRPDVIAKREAREKLKAEREAEKKAKKDAEKEVKRIEKERIRQEMIAVAIATKRRLKEKSGGDLDLVLDRVSPAL